MLDPHNVLKLLGVDPGHTYPIATDCPLCHGRSKLEIRSTVQAHCRDCQFTGDLIELLAAKSEQPVAETLDELRGQSLVDCDKRQRLAYLAEVERRHKVLAFVNSRAERARTHDIPGSVRGIMSNLNMRFNPQMFRKLVPHVIYMTRDHFEEAGFTVSRAVKPVLTWWGKYMALAIPCWDGIEIVGFELITMKGSMYLSIAEHPAIPTAFGQLPSFTDEHVVVVDSAIAALRMTYWSVLCNNTPTSFVSVCGTKDNLEQYRAGRTVYWSPSGSLRHYIRAMNTPDATTLNHRLYPIDIEEFYPANGNWGQFTYQLENALPAHEAATYELLEWVITDARPCLAHHTIDPMDRVKMLTYVSGEDARHLERIFGEAINTQAVSWNGYTITDAPEGWIVRGKLVSAAKLHLEQVRPQGETGDAIVTGMISYRSPDGERHNFAFKELLSVLRKDEGAWLQRKVLSKTGFHPYVERRWSKKLFEISQQFHVPTPVMADQVYGWDNYKLRMPNFIVDAKGLYAKRSTIAGPGTSFPSPLSPAEWDAFKSIGFCRVVLAFMGNLVRTANDRNGIGIMLTNEPHVVTRLSQAFASKIKVCPTPAEIDERNADPLPTFTEWSDHALASIFDQMDGYKNIVFSVDSHTSHLSRLQPDWLHLRVGEAIDYGALRVIFQLLPTLLALRSLSIDGDTFYRDIADILTPAVSKECHRHYLSGAAVDLDTHNTYRGSTAATRILELIFYGVERGQIKPRYRDDVVVVNKKQFRAAICSNIIPVPPYSELTARLQDGRFLFKDTEKYWHFDRMVWDLNASFAGVSHP